MGRHPVTLTDPLSLDPLSLAWLDWMAAARIPDSHEQRTAGALADACDAELGNVAAAPSR